MCSFSLLCIATRVCLCISQALSSSITLICYCFCRHYKHGNARPLASRAVSVWAWELPPEYHVYTSLSFFLSFSLTGSLFPNLFMCVFTSPNSVNAVSRWMDG